MLNFDLSMVPVGTFGLCKGLGRWMDAPMNRNRWDQHCECFIDFCCTQLYLCHANSIHFVPVPYRARHWHAGLT